MNKNVLRGHACPMCLSEGPFHILATALFIYVTDSGTDEYERVSWDDSSHFQCCNCGHSESALGFQGKEKKE